MSSKRPELVLSASCAQSCIPQSACLPTRECICGFLPYVDMNPLTDFTIG